MGPIYNAVSNFITGYKCLGISIILASITCAFSTVCTIIVSCMDKKRQNFMRIKEDKNSKQKAEKINLRDALNFPLELWLIFIICVVFYSATFPFISLGKLFFIRKYHCVPILSSLQQRLIPNLNILM